VPQQKRTVEPMSHVLATVLVSLILPAVALVIILRLERRGNKPEDELPSAAADPNVATDFQFSAPEEATPAVAPEKTTYQERAG
jgi:hypothetical protein